MFKMKQKKLPILSLRPCISTVKSWDVALISDAFSLYIHLSVHIGMHQNGENWTCPESSCFGWEKTASWFLARILWYTYWKIYWKTSPNVSNMDHSWFPYIQDAFEESWDGIHVILGGGLRASWYMCLWT